MVAGGGDVVGILLAAGAGRRMGGPKALVGPLAGDPALRTVGGPASTSRRTPSPLEQMASRLNDGGCDRVIAVIGAHAAKVRNAVTDRPWLSLVEAPDWVEGVGASLRAGLAAAAATDAVAALVMLVDLPDVGADVVRRLLAAAPPATSALARASYGGVPGHPVLLGRDWWTPAQDVAVGDRGARDLFSREPHTLVECGDLAGGADVDSVCTDPSA